MKINRLDDGNDSRVLAVNQPQAPKPLRPRVFRQAQHPQVRNACAHEGHGGSGHDRPEPSLPRPDRGQRPCQRGAVVALAVSAAHGPASPASHSSSRASDRVSVSFSITRGRSLHLCLHLRVRPETLCRITEFSEHESNGRELDEGERVAVEVLPVLGQSAAAVEPGDGAFDHPTPGLDDEALHPIGSLDDLGLESGQDAGQGAVKDRALIGAVGEQFPEKGKQTEQGRQQRETAVAILNVGGGDDAVQQQALRIDQNMPLLALDQLAGIEAVAVDASPPFSALFTL